MPAVAMTESIDEAQWSHYAHLLKGLCKAAGLPADPKRTSDSASVLRPVGSLNWKTGQPRISRAEGLAAS